MVVDEIRKNLGGAVERLTPRRAQELARSLMPSQSADRMARAARDLVELSNRSRERIVELVRAELRSQLKQAGFASRDEVDALRRRVRDLERSQKGPKRSTGKRVRAAASVPVSGAAPGTA
jgi:polyhydroxyalkanoate synthesis regulator phasin